MLTNILLEVGTNEVEIASLDIGGTLYGLNAAKIREIVPLAQASITNVPGAIDVILGLMMHRDEALPLLDIGAMLGCPPRDAHRVAVVIEVSSVRCALACTSVNRIHRLSWEALRPLGDLAHYGSPLIGTVETKDLLLMLLDIERLLGEVFPAAQLDAGDVTATQNERTKRSQFRLFFAEDSAVVRHACKQLLLEAGFGSVETFPDGEEAWQRITVAGDVPDVLVSDIEMPRLDGMTLCRRLKERAETEALPIVLFSSLLEGQEDTRKSRVGADAVLAKPELGGLVDVLDELLGITEA